MKAFKLQMVAQTPATAVASSNYYLGPLDQIKGVQPPLPFGERTRDCSPDHAGKEGPQLARTGELEEATAVAGV